MSAFPSTTTKGAIGGGSVKFNTPLWRNIAVSTTVQFDRTQSTLPNYSQHNFSVMTGPSVRF